jgi:hypothetical protein
MTLQNEVRTALEQAVSSVQPPTANASALLRESGRRTRHRRVMAAAAGAVAVAITVVAAMVADVGQTPEPAIEPPSPADAIWMDGTTLHLGDETVPGARARGPVVPALDGVVYPDVDGTLWYRTARSDIKIDDDVFLTPAVSPDGTMVAWIRTPQPHPSAPEFQLKGIGSGPGDYVDIASSTLVVYDLREQRILGLSLLATNATRGTRFHLRSTPQGLTSPILAFDEEGVWVEANERLNNYYGHNTSGANVDQREGWLVDRSGRTIIARTGAGGRHEVTTPEGAFPLPVGMEDVVIDDEGQYLFTIEGGRGRVLDTASEEVQTLEVDGSVVAGGWSADSVLTVLTQDSTADSGQVWACRAASAQCAHVSTVADVSAASLPAGVSSR